MNNIQRLLVKGVPALALFFIASCSKSVKPEAKAAPPEKIEVSVMEQPLVEVPGEPESCLALLRADLLPLLEKKDYVAVEATALKLRQNKEHLANGVWKLELFYEVLGDPGAKQPDEVWLKRKADLASWVTARPESVTARIALAGFWASYAWKARGTGFSNTVSNEGWRLMEQRLAEAGGVLAAAAALADKCPTFYTVTQRVALGQGWSREDYDEMFAAAIAAEPAYSHYYFNKAHFLLPRWHGRSKSEWFEFMVQSADRLGGEEGDMLYARMSCRIFRAAVYDSFLTQSGVDWARLKRGMEVIVARYPDSLWAKSQLCYFCGQKGEREKARELWKDIGVRVDTSLWNQERFLADRKWAGYHD